MPRPKKTEEVENVIKEVTEVPKEVIKHKLKCSYCNGPAEVVSLNTYNYCSERCEVMHKARL